MRAGLILVVIGAAMWVFVFNTLTPEAPGGENAATPTATATAEAAATPSSSPTPTPVPETGTYTVVSGDSMAGIAADHDVSLEDLLAANPEIADPADIEVGQEINIPDPE